MDALRYGTITVFLVPYLREGARMVLVRSHEGGTDISLCCVLCRQPLTLSTAWLAFPANAAGEAGQWVHRSCADGKIRELVGGHHATLMRGDAALQAMAANLQGSQKGGA
jgi:hypothetical protein